MSLAPPLSASNSLVRDIAICTSMAAIGATIIMTRAAIGLPSSSLSLLPPPKIMGYHSGQFISGQDPHDTIGHSHDRVFLVPSRGKSIRRLRGNDVHLRHG